MKNGGIVKKIEMDNTDTLTSIYGAAYSLQSLKQYQNARRFCRHITQDIETHGSEPSQ